MLLFTLVLVVLLGGTVVFSLKVLPQYPFSAYIVENPLVQGILRWLSDNGMSFDRYGAIYLAMGAAALLIMFLGMKGERRSYKHALRASALELEKAKARIGELEGRAKLPLMPKDADVEDRVAYLLQEAARVDERIRVTDEYEDNDDETEANLAAVDGIRRRLETAQAALGRSTDHSKATIAGLDDILQNTQDALASTKKLADGNNAKIATIERSVAELESALTKVHLDAERFGGVEARLNDLNASLLAMTAGEASLADKLRTSERQLTQAKARLEVLKPSQGSDVTARVASLISEIGKLEKSVDQMDPTGVRQTLDGLRTRIEAIGVQLGDRPKARLAAVSAE